MLLHVPSLLIFLQLKHRQKLMAAIAFFISIPGISYSQPEINLRIKELRSEIVKSSRYDHSKLLRIDSLQQLKKPSGPGAYNRYLELYEEYASFHFDSALVYSGKLIETATTPDEHSLASIKKGFTLLSAGMYKEVFETLESIDPLFSAVAVKQEYYLLKAWSYFDLADYAKGNAFVTEYNRIALQSIDSALMLFDKHTFEYQYYSGLKNIRLGNMRTAADLFSDLIHSTTLSLHEQAIVQSTFSDVFIRKGKTDSAIILLAKAATADLQSSTKETSAIFNLANLLFRQGDLDNASLFIQKASSDATTYGARQRMVQLSNILPMIEAERLSVIQREKKNITRYAFIITILFLLLAGLIVVVIRQVKKMKLQQNTISRKNISLHHLIEEKEWLLKETHHRVKNNLHTIDSLLESQAAFLENDALSAIRHSQHRVFAMSLIHQKLYHPENNTTVVDMQVYLKELINYLKESFETDRHLRFLMVLEPVSLDISLAVPLGLIVNEAVTNAVKYAFPPGVDGTISISFTLSETKQLKLIISDNGVGLIEGFDIRKSKSLGMKLMQGLCDDIAAEFKLVDINGVKIEIDLNTDKSIRFLQNAV